MVLSPGSCRADHDPVTRCAVWHRIENPRDTALLESSLFLLHYPFANRLYPGALDAIHHLERRGRAAVLSDGDVVFQPRKVQRSGLWDAVEQRVLIYLHKEQMLASVGQRFPADRYVMVDDKLRILTAIKKVWGPRVTTIFPRQGHYAHDAAANARFPPADVSVERIGDLLELDRAVIVGGRSAGR